MQRYFHLRLLYCRTYIHSKYILWFAYFAICLTAIDSVYDVYVCERSFVYMRNILEQQQHVQTHSFHIYERLMSTFGDIHKATTIHKKKKKRKEKKTKQYFGLFLYSIPLWSSSLSLSPFPSSTKYCCNFIFDLTIVSLVFVNFHISFLLQSKNSHCSCIYCVHACCTFQMV